LSGGLDSSSIVCLAAELLQSKADFAGQETVTACYADKRYDEWHFAEEVIRKTKAQAHQVFPTFDDLQSELDKFLWHQDEPTGSTSQFSQWSVFKKTHEVGLKVMIDGQGADEQLAGYGGNDLSFYTGLMRGMKLRSLLDEMRSYKKANGSLPVGFLIGAAELTLGKSFSAVLPSRLRIATGISPEWLQYAGSMNLHSAPAKSLQENLNRQVYSEPLPALLRYEDRNSMAWSVESRTPFMDYRLLEFTSGLPERYIYYRGTRKHILREAMKGVLPEQIEKRKDKMGFVTPEEQWIRKDTQWFRQRMSETLDQFPAYFNKDKTIAHLNDVADGKKPFDFSIWRIVCLGKWYTLYK
jgi:asparagine synthase (glutamine-hydrolysing)